MLEGFLNLIIYGGLPIIFILIFLEANPIIGSFIPGQTILIMLSFLIATKGIINLKLFILVVFFGAFLGDIVGFFLGKKYGLSFFNFFKITSKSKLYVSSLSFFKKYGPWSIILGREFNPTRAFIPFLAGLSKMRVLTFIFFAFISNLLWVFISIYLGFYFGYFILDKINFFSHFLIFIIIYYVFISFLYRNLSKFYFKNYFLHKKYAYYNILLIFLSLLLIFILLIYKKLVGLLYFNLMFSFLKIDFFKFLILVLTKRFIVFLFIFCFIFIFYKKNFKLLILYFWGIFIGVILSLIFGFILNKFYSILIYSSIISITQFSFWVYIFGKLYLDKKNYILKKNLLFLFLIFLIFISFLVKFYLTSNFFVILISFLVSLIISEIILLLSHYSILDNSMVRVINSDFSLVSEE